MRKPCPTKAVLLEYFMFTNEWSSGHLIRVFCESISIFYQLGSTCSLFTPTEHLFQSDLVKIIASIKIHSSLLISAIFKYTLLITDIIDMAISAPIPITIFISVHL